MAPQCDCGWLLRTQDPSGAWGYQGNDPGHYNRVAQTQIRPCGGRGVWIAYICADLLKISEVKQQEEKPAVPLALKPVGDPLEDKAKPKVSVLDLKIVRKAMNDGNAWFRQNFVLESEGHTH